MKLKGIFSNFLDKIFEILFGIFAQGKFHNLILRCKLYKAINKKLYIKTWAEIASQLTFRHQQFEISIEDDAIRTTYKVINVSDFVNCKGWKISFAEQKFDYKKKGDNRRRGLLIVFEKDGKDKFKDRILYCINGSQVTVKKKDILPSKIPDALVKFIKMVEENSSLSRIKDREAV